MKVLAVTNLYPTPSAPAQGTFVDHQVRGLRSAGVDVKLLYVNRRRGGPGSYVTVPYRVRQALRSFDADVVHVMYGGVMADLAIRAVRDRPTVVTFHGSDLLGEPLSNPLRRVMAGYGVMCSRRAARHATGIVVVSKALSAALPAATDPLKVRIIPCGIDLTQFTPLDRARCRQKLGWHDDRFHVLFNTNNDDPIKQPELARAAVEQLRRRGVPAEWQELRGLSNDEVPQRLNAADVLLLTSRHEGSPTIVKEALACNLPVVTVDVGDVRDQIREIEGCYLAGADATDLAEKLQLVYRGPRRVAGRAKMEQLSIERIASRLHEFYEVVCGVSETGDAHTRAAISRSR
jgi:glycosyltransferase involved in cell wall biosynthesis